MNRGRPCDGDCDHCPIIRHKNSKMVTMILNQALEKFGNEFYQIVQDACPNLTCCFDCRIDDFCHVEDCEIEEKRKAYYKKMAEYHKKVQEEASESDD